MIIRLKGLEFRQKEIEGEQKKHQTNLKKLKSQHDILPAPSREDELTKLITEQHNFYSELGRND